MTLASVGIHQSDIVRCGLAAYLPAYGNNDKLLLLRHN